MSSISNFELTKPITLFETTWTSDDLTRQSTPEDDDVVGDVTRLLLTYGPGGFDRGQVPTDRWGTDWSNVPDDAWHDREVISGHRWVDKYDVAYLRFAVTVRHGRVGDSMLFLFNQPNVSPTSGLHAAVPVEVGAERADDTVLNHSVARTVAVEQHLIGGWDVSRYDDGEAALERMKNITEVRLLGASQGSDLEVQASCTLLGGMF